MSTIAVTGSTGALGASVINELLKRIPSSRIVAIARSAEKAAPLEELGVEVRIADYNDPTTLAPALHGVDSLLLISANEVGKRFEQHKAVVDAAKEAGVSHLVYTSLLHAPTSPNPLASEHVQTEEYIADSGIPHTFLRNGWYHENYLSTIDQVRESGVLLTGVDSGKVSSASRDDFAEAAAIVISNDGHAGKAYELAGDKAWTPSEFAADLGTVIGAPVTVKSVAAEEHAATLKEAGLPEGLSQFLVAVDVAIEQGALEDHSYDLSELLGRPTTPLVEVLRAA